MTPDEHRAIVDAGYAPLREYVIPTYEVESTVYQPFYRRFIVQIVAATRFGCEYGCDLWKRTDNAWRFGQPFTLADGTWMIRGEKPSEREEDNAGI